MVKKFYPPDFLNQALTVRQAWSEINGDLSFGDLTLLTMAAEIERARSLDEEISRIETILVDKRNQRDEAYSKTWDHMKRVRAAVKGIFGDNSSQYEMVGGTRMSERKSPTRKAAA